MKDPNWTPTAEQVQEAKDVLAWARREMMNEITPELGMAQMDMLTNPGDPQAKAEHEDWLFIEGGYSAADSLGQTMVAQAWRRHLERQEGAE